MQRAADDYEAIRKYRNEIRSYESEGRKLAEQERAREEQALIARANPPTAAAAVPGS